MDTLSDWSFRRGAPPRSSTEFFFGGAPRLNDQSDRVSILGVGTSKDRCLDRSRIDPDRSEVILAPIRIDPRNCGSSPSLNDLVDEYADVNKKENRQNRRDDDYIKKELTNQNR